MHAVKTYIRKEWWTFQLLLTWVAEDLRLTSRRKCLRDQNDRSLGASQIRFLQLDSREKSLTFRTGKRYPYTGWMGPLGSRRLRLPELLYDPYMKW